MSVAGSVPVPAPHGRRRAWSPGILPGFRPTLAVTVASLTLVVLIPLAGLFLKTSGMTAAELWAAISGPRALATYRLSFGGALVAAIVNAVCGLGVAWVLVRYRFPGRALADALVDLPLALPTAVAGIALTTLYAERGLLGAPLHALGLKVAFARPGVIVAMIFVGLPFVVRTVEPVLQDFERDVEEAATSLGATRFLIFRRVIFPTLVPSLLTGFALAFARAVGEYGSVVFISGNMPGRTEIVPLLIVTKLEQYDYEGATALALVMLLGSFTMLLAINALQAWTRKGRRA